MTVAELERLFKTHNVIQVEFDYEFKFWFDNGISVTVEYIDGWEIESNIEKEESQRRWDEAKRKELLKNYEKDKQKKLFIEKYGQQALEDFNKII